MMNTGDATWTLDGSGANDGYYLGSQHPMDNFTWGTNLVFLAADASVAPGQSHTFKARLTAPNAPGVYSMQWQMLQNTVAWWGQMSFLTQLTVSSMPSKGSP